MASSVECFLVQDLVTLSSTSSHWSTAAYATNFRDAHDGIARARYANAGVAPIKSSMLGSFNGDRVIHWSTAGGVLCLREVWLGHPMQDSAVCLRLGGEAKCLLRISNSYLHELTQTFHNSCRLHLWVSIIYLF